MSAAIVGLSTSGISVSEALGRSCRMQKFCPLGSVATAVPRKMPGILFSLMDSVGFFNTWASMSVMSFFALLFLSGGGGFFCCDAS